MKLRIRGSYKLIGFLRSEVITYTKAKNEKEISWIWTYSRKKEEKKRY